MSTLRFLTAGESHGPALTAILDGIPAGLPLTSQQIAYDLARRQSGYGAGPRMKIEKDEAQILSGVLEGRTIGAPISLSIENRDHSKWRGRAVEPFTTPRPGHADLAAAIKYGYDDLRPALERASARETAARVAVGAICRALLAEFGITVGGYVVSLGEIDASLEPLDYRERIAKALQSDVGCPDAAAGEAMRARIRRVMDEKDTLGGVIEVVALGLPAGLGTHTQWDRRLDARIAAAILSIQAMKGVEIGPAFANTRLPGTQVHDGIYLGQGAQLTRQTARSGGTEAGISTGQALTVRAAMKPIPTTLTPQTTVDLATGQPTPTQYERSDFCPVPRGVVIVEAMLCYVLAEALLEKLGGDSIAEMKPRFENLRQARLEDLLVNGQSHIFWPE
ncbi:MAG: chorismate synthase [Chloroflexota bacterium]